MPTNNYFNLTNKNPSESKLFHELVNEAYRIYGIDVYYIPRIVENEDLVWEEDTQPRFESAYRCAMYLNNFEGLEGEGDFLSKFGVEIRDRLTMTCGRREFSQCVTRFEQEIVRPREGDLLWFPYNQKCFEIRFTEHEAMFYQLGDLYVYQLQCELFEYANEYFNTGIKEIDKIFNNFNTNIYNFAILSEDGLFRVVSDDGGLPIMQEQYNRYHVVSQDEDNTVLDTEAGEILDFSELSPFTRNGIF